MKREGQLRGQFVAKLEKRLPTIMAFRHEDLLQSGVPDLSLTGSRMTSWWEFKHSTPMLSGTGLQELTCARLSVRGAFCRYIVWFEEADGSGKFTMIVDPKVLMTVPGRPQARRIRPEHAEASCVGFNHDWLVDYVRGVHKC